ncbi:HAMP domain-containing histidine kinase [bacterium]|nr:HAMP domain-containing histidine kinase [bacterium]
MNTHAVLSTWFERATCVWFETSPFGLLLIDRDGRIVWANVQQSVFTGQNAESICETGIEQIESLRTSGLVQAVHLVLQSGKEWRRLLPVPALSAKQPDILAALQPIHRLGQVAGAVVLFSHTPRTETYEQALRFLQYHACREPGEPAEENPLVFTSSEAEDSLQKEDPGKTENRPAAEKSSTHIPCISSPFSKEWPINLLVAAKQEALQRLVDSFCHELRNVLLPLFHLISDLQHRSDKPSRQETIDRILLQQNEVLKLLQRVEKMIIDYPPGVIPIAWPELLHAAYDLADILCVAKKPPVIFDIADALPDYYGNRAGLLEAFSAIIMNALDAVDEQGHVTVTVRYDAELDRYQIRVLDDGSGIAPEVMPHIFDAFFTTKLHKEDGLGLAIAYRVIQAHEGLIQINSEPGLGTEVRVTLPARHDALPQSPCFNRQAVDAPMQP